MAEVLGTAEASRENITSSSFDILSIEAKAS
jgi:hypothetical protein